MLCRGGRGGREEGEEPRPALPSYPAYRDNKGTKKRLFSRTTKKKKTLTTENTHAHLELILNEASLSCIHSFTRRRAKTDHEGRPHRCSSPARSPTTSGQFNIPKGAQSVVRARRYQQPCEQTDRQIQTLNMTELVVI